MITKIIELGEIAREEGLLALKDEEVTDAFLARGINIMVDGTEPETIKAALERDMRETSDRHKWGAKVFGALSETAPAMGMIGTLIGLVQMLSNMEDPKSIGPAMAVALLTTLYGAMIATMFATPIADKLSLRMTEEARMQSLYIDALVAIQEGTNPRIIEQMLSSYLPPKEREKVAEAEGA